MSRSLRATLALATLTGLLGTTAFGAANGLHALFEHELPHGIAGHGRHPGVSPDDHADSHESEPTTAGHSHAEAGQLHREKTPGHRHPPTLAAELQPSPSRTSADLVVGAPADSLDGSADVPERLHLGPTTRDGPTAAAAPFPRRSVVLQV